MTDEQTEELTPEEDDDLEDEIFERKDLSKCRKWGLHDYKQVLNGKWVVVDNCIKCGHKAVYPKRGRMYERQKQNQACKRSFLQPFGPDLRDFRREYGFELTKARR